MDSFQSRLYETNDSEQEKNKKPAEVPLLFSISLNVPLVSHSFIKKKNYGTATLTSCVTLDKLLNLSMPPLLNW